MHYLGLKNSLVHSNLIVVHYAVHYHVLQSLTLYRILLTLINIFVLLLYRYL